MSVRNLPKNYNHKTRAKLLCKITEIFTRKVELRIFSPDSLMKTPSENIYKLFSSKNSNVEKRHYVYVLTMDCKMGDVPFSQEFPLFSSI